MEHTLQSLELQVLVGDIKKRKEELDARREILSLEQRRIELEWKILDDDFRDIRDHIRRIMDSADYPLDNIEVAPECVLGEGIPDGGKRFDEYADPIEEAIAPIDTVEQENSASIRAAGKLVRYADMPQKKQIKTLLHTILELTNERGKLKIKDLAKELDADEKTLEQWAKIMDKRGMVRTFSSIRGDVFIEKMPYQTSPLI